MLQVLYCAFVWFEQELERQAGRKSYSGGSISFGTVQTRQAWSEEQVKRVKELKRGPNLKGGTNLLLLQRVARVRHYLFHNDAATPVDLTQALSDMAELLRRMWGFKTGGEAKKATEPLPLEWQRIKALSEALVKAQGAGAEFELVLHFSLCFLKYESLASADSCGP